MNKDAAISAEDIDNHVGKRLKAIRRYKNETQEGLAAALGITFQQVQKYESGSNRISASKLYEAAAKLHVAPEAFFEGLPLTDGVGTTEPNTPLAVTLGGSQDVADAALTLSRLRRPAQRLVVQLIEALDRADQDDAPDAP